jgi:hypothetical protein
MAFRSCDIARVYSKTLINVPELRLSFIERQLSRITDLSVNFCPFMVFFNLVLKSTVLERNTT